MKIQIAILLACASLLLAHASFAQSGDIITIAGTDSVGYNGDNRSAITAKLNKPESLTMDKYGNIYIADAFNRRIRKVNSVTGIITTIAGNGIIGYGGDDGPATNAKISVANGVAVDTFCNVYITDRINNRVRKIDALSGIITTIAGTGVAGSYGDGVPATSAELHGPIGLHIDKSNNIFIVDYENRLIRKIESSTGIITTVAGNTGFVSSPDGTLATNSGFNYISGIFVDDTGNIYISEQYGYKVRKVSVTTGLLSTIAGNGLSGFSGDNGLATDARLNEPAGICMDALGNIFFAEYMNGAIRKVDVATRVISTIAGVLGSPGGGGNNGLATAVQMMPSDVEFDLNGNLVIADQGSHRIRRICDDTTCLKIPTDTANHLNTINTITTTQHYNLTPNPTSGDITLTQAEADNDAVTIDVRDIIGKSVYTSVARFTNRTHHLSLRHLPSGLYFMRVRDSKERVYNVRFVVE